MILLDTDHFSVLRYARDPKYDTLTSKMRRSIDSRFAITVITLEEQLRGWLAEINRLRDIAKQVTVYERLAGLVELMSEWEIVRLDPPSAILFRELKNRRIRLGSKDLKIASIALANNALLLTANRADFQRVPGLQIANWLE
ncbi:MAG TPA: type II toxin-antitoxin system VapC family toxin [Gemmataceae bacterium]|nr:type II toxin-antitoxin system VapC family toxin [Gemmataceae bacterium]